jgi:hypothetical protein
LDPDSDERSKPRATGQLSEDEQPWVSIASDVLAGRFDQADRSSLKSIRIGLRSIDDETCKAALKKLRRRLNRSTRGPTRKGTG